MVLSLTEKALPKRSCSARSLLKLMVFHHALNVLYKRCHLCFGKSKLSALPISKVTDKAAGNAPLNLERSEIGYGIGVVAE